jgi:S1-C subfamily serine protease
MKLRLLLFTLIMSTSVLGQQMRFDKKLYYDDQPISIAEARLLSFGVSPKAYTEFSSLSKFYPFVGITAVIGGMTTEVLVSNGHIAAGTIFGTVIFGGASLGSYFALKNTKRRGAMFYNESIRKKDQLELARTELLRKASAEKLKEENRIARFYSMLTERLSQSLTPMEGVFKSIDKGEAFEYDIAILRSLTQEDEYIGLVLKSTDPNLKIGHGIFSFTTTAQPNLYFVSYQDNAGEIFANKTAQLDGGVLTMGLKSFVKMYPTKGEKRKYSEINPLFDWASSGSGVLINKEGYIITNNHVATGAKKIRIAFQNDSIDYNAVIISQNKATDVAILKIEDDRFESNIAPIKWETDFRLGEKVFTLGYPISNKMSNNVKVVDGIISGENGVGGSPIYFQTTLPVWYGNSGGPCFNSKGEILGLATQILWDRGEKVDNVAYITKTENILKLGGELIDHNTGKNQEKDLEILIEELVPYSVFIKVNY